MRWTPPGGAQWRYCAKVGLAAALGYLLTQGNQNQYAVYSAFTAALIVGTNFGEDLAASGNRVKGTLVGMAAGMAVSAFLGPSALALGCAVGLTALVAIALGWGVAVARVGITLCIITLALHGSDALEYDLLRAVNTVIGIATGLAVSFLIWRVRGRDEVASAESAVLGACARLLDVYAAGERDLRPAQIKLYDTLAAMVKAARDSRLERRLGVDADAPSAHALGILQFGLHLLATVLAVEGQAGTPGRPSLEDLRNRLEQLHGPQRANR